MRAPDGHGTPPATRAVTVPLTVRDLTPADLPACGWCGSPLHLAHVERELVRARRGEVDYLAVCPPSGEPVAIGGVDHRARLDAGLLWQLAVGYRAYGRQPEAWDAQGPDGVVRRHETMCTLMRKEL
ncbi:GNAT family N-acetyltransferase [Streptomyces sp. C10]|uniref:GNAT family N-acetyltransferase n=1 Tax=Streptomyces sp. C10 TaxID=531941 RepID=UPI00398005B6